jgi:hypothetical protein
MGFAESFQLVATLAFIAGSALVSIRLLLLASRTHQAPELLLGGAILCTAVLGYGVLIASLVLRGGLSVAPDDVPTIAVAFAAFGRFLHNFGVTLFLLFVVRVFRPGERWAHALLVVLLCLLWGGFAAGAANGTFREDRIGSPGWLCEYVVVWTYALWNTIESYRYWGLMRRRSQIGLADPLVTDRFFLWGTGSLFTVLATWTASIPFLFASDPARILEITPAVRIATAGWGVVSVTCSLFAFLPPAWYVRRFTSERPVLQQAT